MIEQDIQTTAKIIDFGINTNGKGNPQVFIECAVEGASYPTTTWFGQLSSEGSRKITMKAVLICGFKKEMEFYQIAEGKDGGALQVGRTVNVLFGPETWKGKTREKIKFFNVAGSGGGAVEIMAATETKKLLSSYNMKSEMAELRKENPNLDNISENGEEDSVF